MASMLSILKTVIPLNCTHVERWQTREITEWRRGGQFTREIICVQARPFERLQCLCPKCRQKCVRNGHKQQGPSSWRAPDPNGVPVVIEYRPHRIKCPEHGELNEWIPRADGPGRFTADSNDEAAWPTCRTSKSAIATYLAINRRTVGNCVRAAHSRLEPDVSERPRSGLRRICVDETSYSKGHSYVTVVYDMDRNRAVWVHERHGRSVFEQFCLSLTEEERSSIEVVAGDGARWIDECVQEHFPNATRCAGFFHVVEWANEALDAVRISAAAKAKRQYDKLAEEFRREEAEAARSLEEAEGAKRQAQEQLARMPKRGRPSAKKLELLAYIAELDEALRADANEPRRKPGRPKKTGLSAEHQAVLDDVEKRRKTVKGAKHALGHAPENRTANQDQMLSLIEAEQPGLWLAYQLKERLRLILHMRDASEAQAQLDEWLEDASACGIAAMEQLSEKIARHREGILNSIRLRVNSAKSESCNTTIKTLIKMARGFRNLNNMIALIYLKCSDLVVPLHNRPQPSAQYQQTVRDKANARRREREEELRMQMRAA